MHNCIFRLWLNQLITTILITIWKRALGKSAQVVCNQPAIIVEFTNETSEIDYYYNNFALTLKKNCSEDSQKTLLLLHLMSRETSLKKVKEN